MIEFFLIPFAGLLLVLILLKIWSWNVWLNNKESIEKLKISDFTFFDNLTVSSETTGKIKTPIGFSVKATIGISNDKVVIAAKKNSIKLFHTELPIILNKKAGHELKNLTMSSWNSLNFSTKKSTLSSGVADLIYYVDTESKSQKEELYNKLKSWS